jgi:hypothetical protein
MRFSIALISFSSAAVEGSPPGARGRVLGVSGSTRQAPSAVAATNTHTRRQPFRSFATAASSLIRAADRWLAGCRAEARVAGWSCLAEPGPSHFVRSSFSSPSGQDFAVLAHGLRNDPAWRQCGASAHDTMKTFPTTLSKVRRDDDVHWLSDCFIATEAEDHFSAAVPEPH